MLFRLFLLFFSFCCATANAETISISRFAKMPLSDWQQKSFKGNTLYKLVLLDKQVVLQAESESVASSLYKEVRIDLQKTPYLNWSWRIDKQLAIQDEMQKSGDDFAARIYIIIKGEWFFWQTKALNYVWASGSPKGKVWANPFAGNSVMMMAVRSGGDKTLQWYTEKRNVLADIQSYIGEDISYIDAIAIMTDTDNAGGSALSYYDNIYFSAQ